MRNKLQRIDSIIKAGIYLYIVFMFLSKGEGIRNILIFGNFILWLLTLRYRGNLHLLRDPVSIFFWTYIGIIVVFVPFSIDPLYSFLELRHEPLKSALLFPVIATVMAEERALRRVPYVCLFTALLIVLNAYYSYIFYDIPVLKPHTPLMHVWHNKFARYLNTLLAFSFILYLLWDRLSLKLLLMVSFVISILALFLSTSREGYLAFFTIACIWGLYIWKRRGHNFFRVISTLIIVFLIMGILSIAIFPQIRERIFLTVKHLKTLNERSEPWEAAFYAVVERPVLGWGYGDDTFYKVEPYKHLPYLRVPEKGPHNTYVQIIFSQGIIGLIPYILLILVSTGRFSSSAFKMSGIRSYILIACVSIIIGNYIVNALFTVLKLNYLAVVIGLGMAAMGIDEDSHS